MIDEHREQMDLKGQTAIVFGGAGGIGMAIVKKLLLVGVNVTVCDVEPAKDNLRQLQEKFGTKRVLFLRVDVCSDDDMKAAFSTTKENFKRINIVVNAAGIFDDVHWEREVDINLKGVIRSTLLAWKYMGIDEGEDGGVVLNIASVLGIDVIGILPMYCATKHGVVGLSRSLGARVNEVRTGVRVIALCPGGTDTKMMQEAEKGLYHPDWKVFWEFQPVVSPDVVADSAVKLIKEATGGSVWVSEGPQTYRVRFPPRSQRVAAL